jgi:leader peptidase (prepilin peptidase) / N-methyltransferase
MASDSVAKGVNVFARWLALLVAPFAGSLLYALVRRLPREAPDLWGRSRCESCGHALGPLELVPVASYVAQRGRCVACGARISSAHLAAELFAVAIAVAVDATGVRGLDVWAGCALGWTLLALAWIDWEHFLLPDVLTLPLIVAGVALAWLDGPWTLIDRALGAIAGFLGFGLLRWLYRKLRGREGLGQGDAKLLAAAGAWLGWDALDYVVLLAAVFGIGFALLAKLRGARLSGATALPFGPALAAAIFLMWLTQTWTG